MSKIITPTQIHDVEQTFEEGQEGILVKHRQEIPDNFLKDNRDKRDLKTSRQGFLQVASIPVAFYELALREGLDIMKAPFKDTLRWLHQKGLDGFITTDKRV